MSKGKITAIRSTRKIPFSFFALPRIHLEWLCQCSTPQFRCFFFIHKNTLALWDHVAESPVFSAKLGHPEFAVFCKMDERTVMRALKSMEEDKIIKSEGSERSYKTYSILVTRESPDAVSKWTGKSPAGDTGDTRIFIPDKNARKTRTKTRTQFVPRSAKGA